MTPSLYTSAPIELALRAAHIDLPMPTGHGAVTTGNDGHHFTLECGTITLHFYGRLEECARLMGAIDPLLTDEPTVTPQRAQDRWRGFFQALDEAGVKHKVICERFRMFFPKDARLVFDLDKPAAALAAE